MLIPVTRQLFATCYANIMLALLLLFATMAPAQGTEVYLCDYTYSGLYYCNLASVPTQSTDPVSDSVTVYEGDGYAEDVDTFEGDPITSFKSEF